MSTSIIISDTKKLSNDDFAVKTLDELKDDTDNVGKTYIPAVVKDVANYKVPVTEFGKGGSVVGISQPILIRDVYVPNTAEDPNIQEEQVINFDPLASTVSTEAKLVLYPDENNNFFYIHFNNFDWDFQYKGSYVQNFNFNGKNKLIWYTWDKYYYNESDTEIYQPNVKKQLNLSGDLLEENIVYEIEIDVCSFSSVERFTVHKGNMDFRIYFYENVPDIDNVKTVPLKVWGDSKYLMDGIYNTCIIRPIFNLFVPPTDDTEMRPLYNGSSASAIGERSSFPILARAKVYFVKIKNTEVDRGYDIYVMSY